MVLATTKHPNCGKQKRHRCQGSRVTGKKTVIEKITVWEDSSLPHTADALIDVGRAINLGLGHRYRLDSLLARSTCGDVWQATWMQTGGRVTLKTLRVGLPREDFGYFSEALTTEANHLRHLSHPHIVGFQRAGTWHGSPVLVMEQLDQSLTEWLKGQGAQTSVAIVPEAQALEWARQLASALVVLHRSGRKHLDLKPANVLLTRPNARGSRVVKLADFGACLPVDRTQHRLVGTPGWAAPEQLQPVGSDAEGFPIYATSTASDWFALGQLLHRMLYGHLDPFGQNAFRAFDQQAPAKGHPVSILDDSPTWQSSASPGDPCSSQTEALPPPESRHTNLADEAHAHNFGERGGTHWLVIQLLSHIPQERLFAAEWFKPQAFDPMLAPRLG